MTTTTILPNTSIGASYTELADSSDATYVVFTYPSNAVYGFTTFTLPAGAVITQVANRFRLNGPSFATGPLELGVHRSGSTAWATTAFNGTITDYVNYYTDSGGVQPSTQADIDNYSLDVQNNLQAGSEPATLYRLWVDVSYAQAPTTTVSAPTGTITATNSPTAVWAHASPEGLAQAAYQLKVFTAAQYGAGGFDPATSAAAYDTGVVPGAAATLTLPPLPTATTYRAYVRTAQLVNGAYQWALAYGFSTFTINVTAVSVTSLVATAVNASGRVDLLATRTASPVWQTIEWQATYDGGTTWVPLRGYTSVPAPAGTTATAADYEAPNGVAVQYRVRGSHVVGGLLITGAWTLSNVVTWSDTSPCSIWLKDPAHPGRNMHIDAQMPDVLRDRVVGVFRPIGATYPVVVSDVLQAGTSTITIVTRSDAEAAALRTVAAGNVLLLQTPATAGWQWGSRYVAPGALQETWTTPGHLSSNRVWSLALTEVARPPDDGVS